MTTLTHSVSFYGLADKTTYIHSEEARNRKVGKYMVQLQRMPFHVYHLKKITKPSFDAQSSCSALGTFEHKNVFDYVFIS